MRTSFRFLLAMIALFAFSFIWYELLEWHLRAAGISFVICVVAYVILMLMHNADTYGARQRAERLREQLKADIERELSAQ